MSEAIGTREFAEKFGVTLATVSKWCREGKIPNCNQDGKGAIMDQELFNLQSSSVSSS